jgi:GNAT superfamily N-acetyltransferase
MEITFAKEQYPNCNAEIYNLLAQHYTEVKLKPDQIKLNLDDAAYRQMHGLGNLVLITARHDSDLVGYATVFLKADLHSAHTLTGFADSYYLLPAFRRGWAGIKLIREIERVLKELDVKKFYIGASLHMNTAKLFKFAKYQEEETIFSKLL